MISDSWASYVGLGNSGNYIHEVVNHSEHFVHPNDATVHTQTIEGRWMLAKKKLRRQCGTSDALFTSYLHEHMWRSKFRKAPVFGNFICSINEFYNL